MALNSLSSQTKELKKPYHHSKYLRARHNSTDIQKRGEKGRKGDQKKKEDEYQKDSPPLSEQVQKTPRRRRGFYLCCSVARIGEYLPDSKSLALLIVVDCPLLSTRFPPLS